MLFLTLREPVSLGAQLSQAFALLAAVLTNSSSEPVKLIALFA